MIRIKVSRKRGILLTAASSLLGLAAFVLVGIHLISSVQAFSGNGTGTSTDPFIVASCDQLQEVNDDPTASYRLKADIDCSSVSNFTPIGNSTTAFSGTFDGDGFTVSHVTIDKGTSPYAGVFGFLNFATIENVNFNNVSVTGGSYVGVVAGYTYASNFTNIKVTGGTVNASGINDVGGVIGFLGRGSVSGAEIDFSSSVTSTGNDVGGLVGGSWQSFISESASAAPVTGNENVGGLVGYMNGHSIINAYAQGSVTGEDTVGGLVGSYDTQGGDMTIQSTYASGTITSNSSFDNVSGGLIGQVTYERANMDGDPSILYNFFSGSLVANGNPGGLIGSINFIDGGPFSLATDYLNVGSAVGSSCTGDGSVSDCQTVSDNTRFFADVLSPVGQWDFTSTWGFRGPSQYPYLITNYQTFIGGSGTQSDPYRIHDCDQLQTMSDHLAAYYLQTADIDCSDTVNWNSGQGFVPIGNLSTPFAGDYDGNGFTIDGLHINRVDDDPATTDGTDPSTNQDYIGLFGKSSSATFENIKLTNARIRGYAYVGGLVGYMDGGSVMNVQVNTNIGPTTSCTDSEYCIWARYGLYGGGVGGWIQNATLTNLVTAGPVKGSGNIIGGIAGEMDNSSLSNSHSESNIDGGSYLGGLVGEMDGGSISSSYTTGNVRANLDDEVNKPGYYAGGLVGLGSSATITESYATGDVHADVMGAGGLIGYAVALTVSDAYSTGDIDETSSNNLVGYDAGGIAGYVSDGEYSNVYSTGTIYAPQGGAGGLFGTIGTNFDHLTVNDSFTTSQVQINMMPTTNGALAGYNSSNPSTITVNNFWYNPDNTVINGCIISIDDSDLDCHATTDANQFNDSAKAPFTLSGVSKWDAANVWYFSGSDLPILVPTTQIPILAQPTTNQVVKNVPIRVYIPAAPLAGSEKLIFVSDVDSSVTIVSLSDLSQGWHQFTINADAITTSSNVLASSSPTLSDGGYTVQFSYQDSGGGPAIASNQVHPVDVSSVPEILCEAPAVTDTTAHASCTTQPDPSEFGATTWQVRYYKTGTTDYVTVPLSDPSDATVDLTGLTPGTDYRVGFKFTNDWGTSDWGEVWITTTGTAPATSEDTTGGGASQTGTASRKTGLTGHSSNVTIADDDTSAPAANPQPSDNSVPTTPAAGDNLAQNSADNGKSVAGIWAWIIGGFVALWILILVIYAIYRWAKNAKSAN